MSNKYLTLLCLFGSLMWGCSTNGSPGTSEVKSPQDDAPIASANLPSVENLDRFRSPVLDSKGLVVLSDSYSKQSDLLQFYNRDGTVWHEFTFYYDDSDGKFEYENDNFGPYSFHPDYFTLALRLTDQDSKYYEVVVNEEKSLRKYVRKNDRNFKFVTWQNHILGTFAIDFDKDQNPIRQSPDGPVKGIGTGKIDRLYAKSFDGDWLKVEWDYSGSEHDDDNRKDWGWIRWREGNLLLIDWFYFA